MSYLSNNEPEELLASPFSSTSHQSVFVETESFHRAVSQSCFAVKNGAGAVIIIGKIGSGKTTLLNRIAFLLAHEDMSVLRISARELDGAFLESVLLRVLSAFEPDTDADNDLEAAFRQEHSNGGKPVLLLDDAHELGEEGLHALAHIAKMEEAGDPLCRLVIAGHPSFRKQIQHEDFSAFLERVAVTHHLAPLSREEIEIYVDVRLREAGMAEDIQIDRSFFDRLEELSAGNPGDINLLAGRALANAGARDELTADDLEDVQKRTPSVQEDIEEVITVREKTRSSEVDLHLSGKGSVEKRPDDLRKGSISVTQLNAAIEQLGRKDISGSGADDKIDPVSVQDMLKGPSPLQQQPDPPEEDEDFWEAVCPLTDDEEAALEEGQQIDIRPEKKTEIDEIETFITDISDQITSLRQTMDELKSAAEHLEQRRVRVREKIGERIDTLHKRLDRLRKEDTD